MTDFLLRSIARLMARVRVNRVERQDDAGTPVIFKRRLPFGTTLIVLGNCFLALAAGGVRMFVRTSEWLAWERHCFSLLYGDLAQIRDQPDRNLQLPALPGTSLRTLLEQGDACAAAFAAAARELRRAHQLHCNFFHAGWSHGDLHLDNVLYDKEADRAYLIDFDTRHVPQLFEIHRNADDLLVFLLELMASQSGAWQPLAKAFLSAYGEPCVLHELAGHLAIPYGFAKILWYTRTANEPEREMAPRIDILRELITQVCRTREPGVETTRS